MYMTEVEKVMLEGDMGEGIAEAMDFLYRMAVFHEAERFVPVTSVLISQTGDAAHGASVPVYRETWSPASAKEIHPLNPSRVWPLPTLGFHAAWSPPAAVLYANSILGGRTNRETDISARMAAIAGRTPMYGMHLKENRGPDYTVKVRTPVSPTEMGYLGYALSQIDNERGLDSGIPYVRGIGGKNPFQPGCEAAVMDMLDALGTHTNLPLVHVVNLTPEANFFHPDRHADRETLDAEDLSAVRDELTPTSSPELVAIVPSAGVDHNTVRELKDSARCEVVLLDSSVKPPAEEISARYDTVFTNSFSLRKHLRALGVDAGYCPVEGMKGLLEGYHAPH